MVRFNPGSSQQERYKASELVILWGWSPKYWTPPYRKPQILLYLNIIRIIGAMQPRCSVFWRCSYFPGAHRLVCVGIVTPKKKNWGEEVCLPPFSFSPGCKYKKRMILVEKKNRRRRRNNALCVGMRESPDFPLTVNFSTWTAPALLCACFWLHQTWLEFRDVSSSRNRSFTLLPQPLLANPSRGSQGWGCACTFKAHCNHVCICHGRTKWGREGERVGILSMHSQK